MLSRGTAPEIAPTHHDCCTGISRIVQRVLLALVGTGMSREEAYRVVQRNAHTAWNNPGGDFRANLEADGDVTSRLSAAELADCFSTALHQENLGVIWERLGI